MDADEFLASLDALGAPTLQSAAERNAFFSSDNDSDADCDGKKKKKKKRSTKSTLPSCDLAAIADERRKSDKKLKEHSASSATPAPAAAPAPAAVKKEKKDKKDKPPSQHDEAAERERRKEKKAKKDKHDKPHKRHGDDDEDAPPKLKKEKKDKHQSKDKKDKKDKPTKTKAEASSSKRAAAAPPPAVPSTSGAVDEDAVAAAAQIAAQEAMQALDAVDPAPEISDGEWACPACTFVNGSESLQCSMCASERPSDAELAEASATQRAEREQRRSSQLAELVEKHTALIRAEAIAKAASAATRAGLKKPMPKMTSSTKQTVSPPPAAAAGVPPKAQPPSLFDDDDTPFNRSTPPPPPPAQRGAVSVKRERDDDADHSNESASDNGSNSDESDNNDDDAEDEDGDDCESTDDESSAAFTEDDDHAGLDTDTDDDESDDSLFDREDQFDNAETRLRAQREREDKERERLNIAAVFGSLDGCAHEQLPMAELPKSMTRKGELKPFQLQALHYMLCREGEKLRSVVAPGTPMSPTNSDPSQMPGSPTFAKPRSSEQELIAASQLSSTGDTQPRSSFVLHRSPSPADDFPPPPAAIGANGGELGPAPAGNLLHNNGVLVGGRRLTAEEQRALQDQQTDMDMRAAGNNGVIPLQGIPPPAVLMSPETAAAVCKGGILADAMGLGKTRTLIALCEATRKEGGGVGRMKETRIKSDATLVVCPVSVMVQWAREVQKTVDHPRRILRYHGSSDGKHKTMSAFKLAESFDYVLTTYQTLVHDVLGDGKLLKIQWRRVVLDEAHYIRNERSRQSRACVALHADRYWAVSATPLQNSVNDFYPLCKLLRIPQFEQRDWWAINVSSAGETGILRLQVLLTAIMLRRTTDAKMANGEPIVVLPPLTHRMVDLQMFPQEKIFYEALHSNAKKRMEMVQRQGGREANRRKYTTAFEMLIRCRQAVCHPHIVIAALKRKKYGDDAISQENGRASAVMTGAVAAPGRKSGAFSLQALASGQGVGMNASQAELAELEAKRKAEFDAQVEATLKAQLKAFVKKLEKSAGTDFARAQTSALLDDKDKAMAPPAIANAETPPPAVAAAEAAAAPAASSDANAAGASSTDAAKPPADDDDDDEENSCVICISAPMENPVVLPCAHAFCRLCLEHALENQKRCPVCRRPCKMSQVTAVPTRARIEAEAKQREEVNEDKEADDDAEKLGPLEDLAIGQHRHWFMSSKAQELRRILQETPCGEKIVVFSYFVTFLQYLRVFLQEHCGESCDLYYGALNARERDRVVQRFTNDHPIPNGRDPIAEAAAAEERRLKEAEEDEDKTAALEGTDGTVKKEGEGEAATKGAAAAPPAAAAMPPPVAVASSGGGGRGGTGFRVLLASIQSCGVGLNLTMATNVIALEPGWNPAVEQQAFHRVHRIGQTRPVTVHRLKTLKSVEVSIAELAQKKAEIADQCVDGRTASRRLGFAELATLFEREDTQEPGDDEDGEPPAAVP